MFTFLKKKYPNKNQSQGFSLIEMIVVVGIFAILTAIIVFNYGDFNSELIVTNTAYEIAIQAREAQIFGLGVRGTGGVFSEAYGIYMDVSSGETDHFIFFGDTINNNRICQNSSSGDCACAGAEDECLEKSQLNRNIRITRLQVFDGYTVCEDVDKMAITFKRPNPEALILNQESPDERGYNVGYEAALIKVQAPNSREHYVLIRKSGQISVLSLEQVDVELEECVQ